MPPSKTCEEEIMKTFNASRPLSSDAQGSEMICRADGLARVPPDEWTRKLT
jgi:hypothetical protein